MVRVSTGARLHFGFQNLALAHHRLYGGIGTAIQQPRIDLEFDRAGTVACDDDAVEPYVRDAVAYLGVEGAEVRVGERFERHVGLGSGTQLALACLTGVARLHGQTIDPRRVAPDLGRGGRSAVGVATFESGGFVVDAGHPTERFTTTPPDTGTWSVPNPISAWSLPDSWRFVLVKLEMPPGLSGDAEDESMRSAVERADPGIADTISMLLTQRLLPAVVEEDVSTFGRAVARIGRLNGAWYADEQGGVYRPPAGRVIEELESSTAVTGAGQSSWGSTVYGVTATESSDTAVEAAEAALDTVGIEGTIRVTRPRDVGAVVEE